MLPEVSPIFGPNSICIADTAIYTMNLSTTETGCWHVPGATVLQDWGDSISVIWTQPGAQTISAHVVNSIGAFSSEKIETIQVHELPPPIDFSVTITNNEITLLPDSLSYSYQWEFGDGNQSSVVSPSHTYTNTGIYEVTMTATNQNNCSTPQSEWIYIELLGNDLLQSASLSLYPTVATDEIHIDGLLEMTHYELRDNMCRKVLSGKLEAGKNRIDVSKLASGSYFGAVAGYSKSFRIIIQ